MWLLAAFDQRNCPEGLIFVDVSGIVLRAECNLKVGIVVIRIGEHS